MFSSSNTKEDFIRIDKKIGNSDIVYAHIITIIIYLLIPNSKLQASAIFPDVKLFTLKTEMQPLSAKNLCL